MDFENLDSIKERQKQGIIKNEAKLSFFEKQMNSYSPEQQKIYLRGFLDSILIEHALPGMDNTLSLEHVPLHFSQIPTAPYLLEKLQELGFSKEYEQITQRIKRDREFFERIDCIEYELKEQDKQVGMQ
jgi:hypothetical protein